MPRVPTYQPTAEDQPIRTPRRDPTLQGSPIDTTSGREQAEAIGQGLTAAMRFMEAEKKKADDLAVLEYESNSSAFATERLYNKDKGALNRRGKDAFGVIDDVRKDYDSYHDELEKKLSNESQRAAARARRSQRWESVDQQLQRHVSHESRVYDDETTENFLINSRNEAIADYLNDETIGKSVKAQQDAIDQNALRLGKPPEWVAAKKLEASSKTQVGVLERMLAKGEDMLAQTHFDNVKDQLTSDDRTDMLRKLEHGSVLGEAQRQAQEIGMKTHNLGEALKQVQKIKDPKVQEKAKDILKENYAMKEAGKKQYQEVSYESLARRLDKGEHFTRIEQDPRYMNLDASQRTALRNRIGKEVVNDDNAWLDFLDLNPGQLASLTRAEFETRYWSKLDRAHKARAEAVWDTVKSSNEKDPKITSALTFKDRLDNSIKKLNVISASKEKSKYSTEEATLYARLEEAAASELENFELTQLAGKRKATGEEVQKIIDGVMLRKVFVEKSFARDPEKQAATLSEDEKGRAYVPYDSIPENERAALESRLTKLGKKIDPKKLERAYGAALLGDKKRLQAILAE